MVLGGLFIIVCSVGIWCSLCPNWLRRWSLKKEHARHSYAQPAQQALLGHHPACHTFETHRINLLHTYWCAGCVGLLFGCLGSIVLMLLYLVVPYQPAPPISRILLFVGLGVIALVYMETTLGSRSPIIHVFLNSLLILSFFVLTMSTITLTQNLEYGVYALILCLLFLDTRIQLSRWKHNRLCGSCQKSCKFYVSSIIFGR
jgi:hypothetical protein